MVHKNILTDYTLKIRENWKFEIVYENMDFFNLFFSITFHIKQR